MLRTPKADEMVVIYETRKNRISGAFTQVIDLRPQGKKYALKCVTHDYTTERNVRLAAEAESHKSHEWCPSCTDVRSADKREKAPAKVIILNGEADAVKTFPVIEPVTTQWKDVEVTSTPATAVEINLKTGKKVRARRAKKA